MQKRLKHILAIAGFIWVEIAFAQDPQLSQFYASPLYTNPAFAGSSRKIRFTANVRNQYTALSNNYKTAIVSIDGYLSKLNGGLGLIASADQAGDGFLTTTTIAGIYSYNFNITREISVMAAIQAGMNMRSYDFSKFTFLDQIDPVRGPVLPTAEASVPNRFDQRIFMNFASGVLLYSDKFYVGIATHNLLEPNQSFYHVNADSSALLLPRRYTAHGGVNIYLKNARFEENRVMLSPNVLFMQQRGFYQINLGAYIKKQALTVGVWFRQTSRNADAIIGMVGLRFPAFRIGYSYDATISSAHTATVGSHEISLGIELKTQPNSNRRHVKAIKCPEF